MVYIFAICVYFQRGKAWEQFFWEEKKGGGGGGGGIAVGKK